MWHLFAMKLNSFPVESTLWEPSPLHGWNQETKQKTVEFPCRRFYYFDRSTTCFADFPSFRSKLSETLWSIIQRFAPSEKRTKQAVPKIAFYHLYRSQSSDLSWQSIHILVRIIESFMMSFFWSRSEEMQTWLSSDADSKTLCQSYQRECAMCAWLQS